MCLQCLIPAQADLMSEDSTPSAHSSVARSYSPYSSPRLMALGFSGKTWQTEVERTVQLLGTRSTNSCSTITITDLDNVVIFVSTLV